MLGFAMLLSVIPMEIVLLKHFPMLQKKKYKNVNRIKQKYRFPADVSQC